MDKKIAGLLGAAAALTTMASVNAQASPANTELTTPASYRDLLEPVANPLPALQADNARLAKEQGESTEVAQLNVTIGHHHHHHHRVFHHHHHHHHVRVRVHHHHHHHHH